MQKNIRINIILKVPRNVMADDDYDSEEEELNEGVEEIEETDNFSQNEYAMGEEKAEQHIQPHDCPDSYAWTLIRLALVRHMLFRLQQFFELAGFDVKGI